MKNPEIKNIKEMLSKIPDSWQLKDDSKNYMNSIFEYLLKIKKDNSKISFSDNLESYQIPYNNSIFHFLLYYSYSPKYPFIIHKENNFIFGAFSGKNFSKVEISFALTSKSSVITKHLNWLLSDDNFKSILEKNDIKKILLRDIDDVLVKSIKKEQHNFKIESLRELKYATYDIKKTLSLKGLKFSNLRWHINNFKKEKYDVEIVNLSDSVKEVIHLIGKWRKNSIEKRNFSYVNVKSDKLGARLFGDKETIDKFQKIKGLVGPENILSRVLKIDGKVVSFNLGFPLGIFKKQDLFAHCIGISDLSISHLAEYAQYDFWEEIKKKGYKYVNDGPTWKKELDVYKKKFRPIAKKRYYWATISLKN